MDEFKYKQNEARGVPKKEHKNGKDIRLWRKP